MTQARVAPQAPAPRPPREVLKLGRVKAAPAAPAPIAPPAIVVVPSAPELIPLGKLRRASENVRHIRIDEDCETLADGIQAHGLLQCLIGYRLDGYIEIVDGGRRLKGMRIVKARGHIDDDFMVPVLIRSMDEAIELSLDANLQHRRMSPVDEFRAFALLMERGDTSPTRLAARFGMSETIIRQRLRFAKLAPPILDALAECQITLDAAMAYATSQDTGLQTEVFEHQAKRGETAHQAANIRLSLRMKGIDTADRLYRFVGAAHYEREGGAYEDDLFTEAGNDRVLRHPYLLDSMASRKVDDEAVPLLDQLRRDPAWAPTIVGHVKTADMRLHPNGTTRPMRPPAGFTLAVREEDSDALWHAIRHNGVPVHVVVGIDITGSLIADPHYAFVPVGRKAAIERPAPIEQPVDQVADQQRGAVAERERQILRWTRRLAISPFTGTPLEGRAFWPEPPHDRPIAVTRGDTAGFYVPVWAFVTHDEIASQRKAAAKHVDELIAARAAEGATA